MFWASRCFAASGYLLHHTLPRRAGLAVWFRYYPSRSDAMLCAKDGRGSREAAGATQVAKPRGGSTDSPEQPDPSSAACRTASGRAQNLKRYVFALCFAIVAPILCVSYNVCVVLCHFFDSLGFAVVTFDDVALFDRNISLLNGCFATRSLTTFDDA